MRITLIGSLVACFSILAAGTSRADGTFRWQNMYNGWYLEVWLSSTANQADVITYPLNAASSNQLWSDTYLGDEYYRLQNNNSWKFLGHRDEGRSDDLRLCGFPDQYDWVNTSYQHWKFRWEWSGHDQRYFNFWINRAGCQGDPYHDALGALLLNASGYPITTSLYTEELCSDQRYGPQSQCYWNRG
ncbi:RICIN domain-containing protein [Microtetraspora sp. NBRC 13810]|uniref:RICIN domain-containing protein n=1 Tax=Microtetraspora sp. NBRC 13810 TaxID=3030990 RepID=UPI003329ECE6